MVGEVHWPCDWSCAWHFDRNHGTGKSLHRKLSNSKKFPVYIWYIPDILLTLFVAFNSEQGCENQTPIIPTCWFQPDPGEHFWIKMVFFLSTVLKWSHFTTQITLFLHWLCFINFDGFFFKFLKTKDELFPNSLQGKHTVNTHLFYDHN